MFYTFTDLDRYDSSFLLNYLIDIEPVIRHKCPDKGYEEYFQCTDAFIYERIPASNFIINQMMNDLVDHEYISVHHAGNKAKGVRYIKLNQEKICRVIGL